MNITGKIIIKLLDNSLKPSYIRFAPGCGRFEDFADVGSYLLAPIMWAVSLGNQCGLKQY